MLTKREEYDVREKQTKKKASKTTAKTGVVRPWLVDVSIDELK